MTNNDFVRIKRKGSKSVIEIWTKAPRDRIFTSKFGIGYELWTYGDKWVLLGTPFDNVEHNCDAQGCGFTHVLERSK